MDNRHRRNEVVFVLQNACKDNVLSHHHPDVKNSASVGSFFEVEVMGS